jgi:hypothetical protein
VIWWIELRCNLCHRYETLNYQWCSEQRMAGPSGFASIAVVFWTIRRYSPKICYLPPPIGKGMLTLKCKASTKSAKTPVTFTHLLLLPLNLII